MYVQLLMTFVKESKTVCCTYVSRYLHAYIHQVGNYGYPTTVVSPIQVLQRSIPEYLYSPLPLFCSVIVKINRASYLLPPRNIQMYFSKCSQ